MADFMQFILTGVTVGLVYSLIALGFTFIWKSSSVANLALGQMVLLFSWIAYGALHQAGMPFWIGLPVTILAAVGGGWILERVVLRPLIGQPILSLVTVTLGIAFVFEGIVSMLWPISTAAMPAFIPDTPVQIFGAVVSQEYLWAAGIALGLFVLVSVFLAGCVGLRYPGNQDIFSFMDVCGGTGSHRRRTHVQHRRNNFRAD